MALPLILGGITLAAVGYGIKKYCDDNDDCLVSIGDKIGDAIDKVDDAVMGGLDKVETYFQDKTEEEKSNKIAIYRNCQEDQKEVFQDVIQPFMTLFAQVNHSPFKALGRYSLALRQWMYISTTSQQKQERASKSMWK